MKKYFFGLFLLIAFTLMGSVNAGEPEIVRVGLLRLFYNQTSISISSTNIEVGHGMANGSFAPVQTLTSSAGFTVQVVNGQVVLRAGSVSGNIVFTFNSGTGSAQVRGIGGGNVTLGNYTYRGIMEFHPYATGRITAVNVINVEDYILGVLPLEMSPTQFHQEALRAQSVAIRTFSIHTRDITRRHSAWLDLCDRPQCCQSYRGIGNEHANTNQAAEATRGLMMFLPGGTNPLFTPYFASSGGATANSEQVWWESFSHLRGVLDPYEQVTRNWSREFTWAQVTARVQDESPASVNIGNVTAVTVTGSTLGRVHELTFTGTNGEWVARGERIRTMFGADSQNFAISGHTVTNVGAAANVTITDGTASNQRPSTALTVLNHLGQTITINSAFVTDGTTTRQLGANHVRVSGGTGITLTGRGWGHGVGMSQHGANGMAQAGHNFVSILQHYYTGVEIR